MPQYEYFLSFMVTLKDNATKTPLVVPGNISALLKEKITKVEHIQDLEKQIQVQLQAKIEIQAIEEPYLKGRKIFTVVIINYQLFSGE